MNQIDQIYAKTFQLLSNFTKFIPKQFNNWLPISLSNNQLGFTDVDYQLKEKLGLLPYWVSI